ncbi:extracellular catalytic domain type 1 short-chain-length polyhydroxyalkanoate depolymerase [Herpetosiphon llansteffanensis]|uniref:extracellular catalytic domain type 1 short-chain-length polyhydroxyalkanoate depolymerase n=1 Tax=Herpetosiphon llansteffanensis TaxID=2094568 RepID=UPI000D7C9C8C|nr:PHB depolymerase family esterase [Herpetosiphon llansteffanensis]
MKRGWLIGLLLLGLLAGFWSPQAASAGQWVTGSVNTSAGSRNYKLWVPTNYSASTPTALVVMLHGCTQTPDDFARGTEMNNLADAQTFLVLYPEQPTSSNANRCWQWWDAQHQARGAGEPSLIAAMVTTVQSSYNVDPNRRYVAGISAGAGMSVIMGATYPDMFSAIGVVGGLEYKAATSVLNVSMAMQTGGPNPEAQGLAAYQSIGTRANVVRVMVVHGSTDAVVAPINGQQVVQQWLTTNDYLDDSQRNNSVDANVDQTIADTVPNGRSYTRTIYNNAANQPIIEHWAVNGMGHAWSGGSTAGSYTDPQGPKASNEFWRFFSQTTANPTPSNPTATPNNPTATPSLPSPTPGTGQSLQFPSWGLEDGLVAQTTLSGYVLIPSMYVGDSGSTSLRGILSFDTSAIPDGATITGVNVTLAYDQSAVGTPWTGLGALVGDLNQGCLSFTCYLELGDFAATASASGALSFQQTPNGLNGTANAAGLAPSTSKGARKFACVLKT